MYQSIELTDVDRAILESYFTVIDGLANYLGRGYEIVLHSLENLEHSVIYIVNGEHTGRKIGAPITDLALQKFQKIEKDCKDEVTYFTKNKKGEPLKSATIVIRGEHNRAIGLLCMNLYLNTTFLDMIESFSSAPAAIHSIASNENFAENSEELILSALESAKESVLSDSSISVSNKNKAIVSMLYEKGIFNIKDSVVKVADLLGISRNTVYLHIRSIKM